VGAQAAREEEEETPPANIFISIFHFIFISFFSEIYVPASPCGLLCATLSS
jgi:hypothetical protein